MAPPRKRDNRGALSAGLGMIKNMHIIDQRKSESDDNDMMALEDTPF